MTLRDCEAYFRELANDYGDEAKVYVWSWSDALRCREAKPITEDFFDIHDFGGFEVHGSGNEYVFDGTFDKECRSYRKAICLNLGATK